MRRRAALGNTHNCRRARIVGFVRPRRHRRSAEFPKGIFPEVFRGTPVGVATSMQVEYVRRASSLAVSAGVRKRGIADLALVFGRRSLRRFGHLSPLIGAAAWRDR
jgi:hypothetical protein